MTSHCGFIYIFRMIKYVEHLFMIICWLSLCLLWKNVYSVLLPILIAFFFWCWVVWAVCICLIFSLYWLYHLQIFFSNSLGCLFILSVVSFAVQKLLSLIKSHLFIFTFISFILGNGSKKILLWFMSRLFNLCFPLGILWFLILYFGF